MHYACTPRASQMSDLSMNEKCRTYVDSGASGQPWLPRSLTWKLHSPLISKWNLKVVTFPIRRPWCPGLSGAALSGYGIFLGSERVNLHRSDTDIVILMMSSQTLYELIFARMVITTDAKCSSWKTFTHYHFYSLTFNAQCFSHIRLRGCALSACDMR